MNDIWMYIYIWDRVYIYSLGMWHVCCVHMSFLTPWICLIIESMLSQAAFSWLWYKNVCFITNHVIWSSILPKIDVIGPQSEALKNMCITAGNHRNSNHCHRLPKMISFKILVCCTLKAHWKEHIENPINHPRNEHLKLAWNKIQNMASTIPSVTLKKHKK
jgi:hypothetical protein